MRISAFFVPLFAFFAGLCGFYIRLMELINVFDPDTGLPERGAALTTTLILVTAAFLFVAFIFALRATMKHKAPYGFENAFGTDPLSYPLIFSAVGMIWLGATVKHYFDLNAAEMFTRIDLFFIVLSAVSAISVTLFSIEMYQDPRRKIVYALGTIPILFMCFWLILIYRQNATNPVILSYSYQCLAIIASALGFYFTSGFLYGKPAPGKAIFTYLAAVYFCFVTLADKHSISIKLIIASFIIINLVSVSMLVRNLRWKDAE